MSDNKGRKATVDLYLNRSDVNGLLYVLDCYERTGGTNKYVRLSNNLKENIQNYGRMFTNDNGENVLSVHLYEKEASTLIMLFSVFISSVTEIEHDYFAELEERYNDRRAAAEAD